MLRRLLLVSAALYIPRDMITRIYPHESVSPDACGTTRQHQRTEAFAESLMWQERSEDQERSELCNIANIHC